MKRVGYSTGAISKGDFGDALKKLRGVDVDAVELSALRETELDGLLEAIIAGLDLSRFSYCSIHAPKDFAASEEDDVVEKLRMLAERGFSIIVHPDAISNFSAWRTLGSRLCVENMDSRKSTGRTAEELERIFKKLPDASFCLDLGHARQVDPSMTEAAMMLIRFGDRLIQVHISEVDTAGNHRAMSAGCMSAFERLAGRLPESAAVIVESVVAPDHLVDEIRRARGSTSADAED